MPIARKWSRVFRKISRGVLVRGGICIADRSFNGWESQLGSIQYIQCIAMYYTGFTQTLNDNNQNSLSLSLNRISKTRIWLSICSVVHSFRFSIVDQQTLSLKFNAKTDLVRRFHVSKQAEHQSINHSACSLVSKMSTAILKISEFFRRFLMRALYWVLYWMLYWVQCTLTQSVLFRRIHPLLSSHQQLTREDACITNSPVVYNVHLSSVHEELLKQWQWLTEFMAICTNEVCEIHGMNGPSTNFVATRI